MARVTAEQATAKWVERLSASSKQIEDGVRGVTVAPGQKAAAASDLWLARVTAAKDKWKSRVGAVTLDQWQAAMIANIPRVAQGAQMKKAKVTDFMAQFLPYLDEGKRKVDAIPKGGIEQSIARAAEMIRHNAAFVRK